MELCVDALQWSRQRLPLASATTSLRPYNSSEGLHEVVDFFGSQASSMEYNMSMYACIDDMTHAQNSLCW